MRRKLINKPERLVVNNSHWSVDETLNAIEEYACCKVRGRVIRAFEHTAVQTSSFINWPLYWSCIGRYWQAGEGERRRSIKRNIHEATLTVCWKVVANDSHWSVRERVIRAMASSSVIAVRTEASRTSFIAVRNANFRFPNLSAFGGFHPITGQRVRRVKDEGLGA